MAHIEADAMLKGAALACFLAVGCETASSTDAGIDATEEGCSGSANVVCCESCLNDVKRSAVCVGGAWQCPTGTVTEGECASTCTTSPFCTYLPSPECMSCTDGGLTGKVCNQDAGHLECPVGTYQMTTDGGCGQDASAE